MSLRSTPCGADSGHGPGTDGHAVTVAVHSDHQLWGEAICSLLQQIQVAEVIATGSLTGFPPVAHHAHRPDVLLVILADPSLDAAALASSVRCEYPSSKLIIVSTVGPKSPVFAYLMKAEPDAYLGTCCSGADLARAIQVVTSGGKWLPDEVVFRNQRVRDGPEERIRLLTVRECEVLGLVVRGYSNAEIGSSLFISRHTVKAHVGRIFEKLRVSSRGRLVALAHSEGLFKLLG